MADSTNTPVQDFEEMSFRQGMDELTRIVQTLESNTLELEESLKSYERGIALLRNLRGRLDAAHQQIDVLMGELAQIGTDEEIDSTLSKA